MIALSVIELFVVLAEEIDAVVAAVGRAHHRVHVVSAGLLVVEGDTWVMIELHEDDWAVHPVVERRVVAGTAVPREPRVIEV